MTKRWSSARSDLSKTKRQVSKDARTADKRIVRTVLYFEGEEYELKPIPAQSSADEGERNG